MSSSAKLNQAVDELKNNPYFDKYADRISKLQKTSPEEFLQRINAQEKAKIETEKKKFASIDTGKYASVLNPKESLSSDSNKNEDKKLDALLKTELVKDKSPEEIQTIWQEYHKGKEVICGVVPIKLYERIRKCASLHGTFILPLPRDHGYEFILCQTNGNSVHFTPLLAYQVHKENAPECLTMVHYSELSDKGFILMRGDYDKKVLNGQEAQCLANQYQMYYGGGDPEKTMLLRTFTTEPDNFKHMDLIKQLENLTL